MKNSQCPFEAMGPRRRAKLERPAQILEAAFAEFTEKGYAAARLEDVARRVGVSKGLIYVYFPTKAELFKAVARSFLQPLMDRDIDVALAPGGRAADLLEAVMRECYADMLSNAGAREFMRLMVAEGARVPELVDFYVTEVMAYGLKPLTALLRYGVETGEFRPEVLEYEHPDIVFGPAVMLVLMQMLCGDRPVADPPRWIAAHLDLVLNGVRAR